MEVLHQEVFISASVVAVVFMQ